MVRPLRRVGLLLITAYAFALAGAGGCSRQGEGERCDFVNGGDADCDDGLECVANTDLVNSEGADRCCPPAGESFSDSRCTRGMALPPSTGGSAGTGGSAAGMAGAAGDAAGGMGGTPTAGAGGEPPGGAAGEAGTSAGGAGGA